MIWVFPNDLQAVVSEEETSNSTLDDNTAENLGMDTHKFLIFGNSLLWALQNISLKISDSGNTSLEWESDWESEDENMDRDLAKAVQLSCEASKSNMPISDNEASDHEAEKCPICLLSFRNQEVASPAVCDHCFCFECLTEWSKNVNTCPVDRQSFTLMNVKDKFDGKVSIKDFLEKWINIVKKYSYD